MRSFIGSIAVVAVGAFVVAAGCGTSSSPPSTVDPGAGSPGSSAASGMTSNNGGSGGSGASSGGFNFAGTSNNDMCPSTCAALNANCGFVTDVKCSGVVECGTCPEGQFCGGDGESRCGTGTSGEGGACSGPNCQACVPKTCAEQGFNCGPAGDTCGNKLDCGTNTCANPGWTCGGGSQPGVCGCTGACAAIPDCSAAPIKTTSISGTVFDPAGINPLPRVFVYVANDPSDPDLQTFKPGVTCDVCGATAAGAPLLDATGTAGTFTDTAGRFKLSNVPVGKGITVVIQLGRWRRVFKLDVDNACQDNAIAGNTLKFPTKKSEGNIPLMAMVTGASDSLECVLRKMGIDQTEFTNPAQGGRVQFYLGSNKDNGTNGWGQRIDANTPLQSVLFANGTNGQPAINGYDMTLLACQGFAPQQSPADLAKLRAYASSGGRVFTTHYAFSWLNKNDANTAQAGTADNWSETAQWKVDEGDRINPVTGKVDLVSNPKGNAFQEWLLNSGASTVPGQVQVTFANHDTDGISSKAGQVQQWLYRDGTNKKKCSGGGGTCTTDAQCTGGATCTGNDYTGKKIPLHFTFNTPVNLVENLTSTPPALQCGRVLFSDFHVKDVHEHDKVFPAECDTTPMTPQEKLLEYMLFDLGSCVPPIKACVPLTQCPAGDNCGYAPDGCGGLISCGKCPDGQSCGVGSPPVPNKCGKGTTTCTPKTCAAQGVECGPAADGCGAKYDSCGTCPAQQLCLQGKCIGVN